MAALVAALLIHATDRTAWLAGMLGTRHAPAPVIAGLALGIAASNALAALGGALLAPELGPDARDLLLGAALLTAGVGACWPPKPPSGTRHVSGFLGGLFGAAILALGDRTLFVTLALATRTATPALAAVGATLGALAVVAPATMLGERRRRRLPLATVRIALGAVLAVTGAIQSLGALRLI